MEFGVAHVVPLLQDRPFWAAEVAFWVLRQICAQPQYSSFFCLTVPHKHARSTLFFSVCELWQAGLYFSGLQRPRRGIAWTGAIASLRSSTPTLVSSFAWFFAGMDKAPSRPVSTPQLLPGCSFVWSPHTFFSFLQGKTACAARNSPGSLFDSAIAPLI